jgi:hypothetical protein
MRHFTLTLLFVVTAGWLRSQVAPETSMTAAKPQPDQSASPIVPAVTPDSRSHTSSPDLTAKITSAVPKFYPGSFAEVPKPEEPAEPADLRETDKPRNTIIRLPQHVVTQKKEPAFKERELLTPKGKLDLAYKRQPGLGFGSLGFFSNDGIARFMLEEELTLERKAEYADFVGLYNYSDPKTGSAVKSQGNDIFLRPSPAHESRR